MKRRNTQTQAQLHPALGQLLIIILIIFNFNYSSAKSTDTLELLDMANNVDLFEKDEEEEVEQPCSSSQMIMAVSAEDEEPMDDNNWCDSGDTSELFVPLC